MSGSRLSAEESRARLVDAATRLFRERPPADVSVREIAALAEVNHGLIHRHFGGKGGLVTAVLRGVFRETGVAVLENPRDLRVAVASGLAVMARERWVVDVLAHALLSGEPIEGLPTASMMPAIRERLGERAGDELAGAVAAAEAATLGWFLFEPLIARGTGLDHLPADRRRALVADALARVLQASLPEGLDGLEPNR
jgi:AcrR family transcriptional regulator